MGPFVILRGLAGVVAGLPGLAARGSLRPLRIGSRKHAAVATGVAFVVCLAAGACGAPPEKADPAKATSPAPAVKPPAAVTATPAPIPTITPTITPGAVATVVPAAVPAPRPAASPSPATVSSFSSSIAGCGEDSYVNVDGNCVHRPVSSSSAPAGATAQCADGTYSFSQHRSGTCSHHGGVAAWL